MRTRLISFLNKTDTLYKYQFGFRKGYSTKLALLEITEPIRDPLDEGNYALWFIKPRQGFIKPCPCFAWRGLGSKFGHNDKR